MKKVQFSRRGISRSTKAGLTLAAAAVSLAISHKASAAITATWVDTDANSNWSDGNNWSTAPMHPGSDIAGVTTNGDTAVFDDSTTPSSTVNLDVSNWNLLNITFTTANANSFEIGTTAAGANSLLLSAGGQILEDSTVSSPTSELINAPIVLEGNYTFENDSNTSASGLKFNGNISAGISSPITLTLQGSNVGGSNSSNDQLIGNISNGASSALGIVKTGAGNWELASAGTNTYSGATLVSGGILSLNTSGAGSAATDVTVTNAGSEFLSAVTAAPFPTVHSVTLTNLATLGQSNSSCGLNIANNSGPAIVMNDQTTSVAVSPVAANVDLTGTGGILSVINSAYSTHYSWTKNLDLGTTSHLIYQNAGTSSTDLQINGIVSSDGPGGGIIKSGNGAVKLQQSAGTVETFAGPIEIQEGSLKLVGNENNQLPGTNDLLIDGGNFNPGGAGSVGDVTVGSLVATAGSISDNAASRIYSPSFNFSIAAGQTFSVGASLGDESGGTVNGASGTGASAVTIAGPGQVTFSGTNNTYSAGTTVNGAILLANANLTGINPLGTGAVNINGSTLSFDPNASAGSGTAISYSVATAASAPQFTFGGGNILNVKAGNETNLTVTIGDSSLTGSVLNRVNNGTLVIAAGAGTADLGVNEQLILTGTAPATVNGIVSTNIVGQNNDSNASGDFLTYNATTGFGIGTYSASTNINTAGASAVYNGGSGSNNNTLSGNAGVYALNDAGQTIDTAGNTLSVGSNTSGSQAGVILNGGSVISSVGSGVLDFGASEGTVYTSKAGAAISAGITGSGGLTLFGPGKLTLTGSNTFTGGLNINQGTVNVSTDSNLGASGGSITFGGGTLQFASSFPTTVTRPMTINAGNGTIDTQAGTITVSGAVTGAGALTKVGSGDLILAGPNSYAGATTISAGNLQIGSGGASSLGAGAVLDNGGLVFDLGSTAAVANAISGSGSVAQNGSSILNLSASNSYAGATTVNAGTLQVSNADALGFGGQNTSASVPVATVNAAATLDLNAQTVDKSITLNGGTLTNSNTSAAGGLSTGVGGYIVTSPGSGVAADYATVSGGGGTNAAVKLLLGLSNATVSAVTAGSGYTTAPTVTVTGGGGTGATAVATLNGSGGIASVTITNPGVGYFSTPSFSFSGGGGTGAGVTADNDGFIAVGAQATAPGTGYTSAPAVVPLAVDSSAGVLTEVLPTVSAVLNTVNVAANSTINGAGAVVLNTGVSGASAGSAVTLNLDGTSAANAINGVISDGSASALALSKSNSSTWTLAGANTFSGGVSVSGGKLLISRTSATTSALPKGALTITGGVVELATNVTLGSQSSSPAAPTSNVHLTSLSIAGAGQLDINNNHILIDYTAGHDPIASIAAMIASGFANGAWTGNGIISTAAATNKSYGIGYADAADASNPAGLSSGEIEIMYTLLGDANLDGKVNGTDFAILASNFNQSVTGWDKGDFNYDNKANGIDFTELAANFNQGASQSADESALQAFAVANGLSTTSVPEPASTGLIALGVMSVLSRRRRKSR